MTTDAITWLHASLALRETPETVAAHVLDALGPEIPPRTKLAADRVANASLKKRFGWSSMATRFRGVDSMEMQIKVARELAHDFLAADLADADEVDELHRFVQAFNDLIGKTTGANDFLFDRLNREDRTALGFTISRRRYDKLFRTAQRLEDRLARLERGKARHALLMVAKSGLVADLKRAQFEGKPWSASFVAYFAARMKLRSAFTISGQQRPFDELSNALFEGCVEHENADWFAIAHVFPREDVLARLTDAEKGALLGRWFGVLVQTADMLQQAHERSDINLETMVVKRGNDSSTWNTFAGAWNRARDHWIALAVALGMERIFDALLPGKVMRLMAADVAAWHRAAGGGLHPDTLVWRELPKPWLVLAGGAVCTRQMIDACCAQHGIDGAKSGWSAPRPRDAIADFKPTPELVHGVSVENPYLAHFLRKLGVFSGKELKLEQIAEILNPT